MPPSIHQCRIWNGESGHSPSCVAGTTILRFDRLPIAQLDRVVDALPFSSGIPSKREADWRPIDLLISISTKLTPNAVPFERPSWTWRHSSLVQCRVKGSGCWMRSLQGVVTNGIRRLDFQTSIGGRRLPSR